MDAHCVATVTGPEVYKQRRCKEGSSNINIHKTAMGQTHTGPTNNSGPTYLPTTRR